jgi:hypothetical protein
MKKIISILVCATALFLTGCGRADFVFKEARVYQKTQCELQRGLKSATYEIRFYGVRGKEFYESFNFEFPDDFAEVGQQIVISNKMMFAK